MTGERSQADGRTCPQTEADKKRAHPCNNIGTPDRMLCAKSDCVFLHAVFFRRRNMQFLCRGSATSGGFHSERPIRRRVSLQSDRLMSIRSCAVCGHLAAPLDHSAVGQIPRTAVAAGVSRELVKNRDYSARRILDNGIGTGSGPPVRSDGTGQSRSWSSRSRYPYPCRSQ